VAEEGDRMDRPRQHHRMVVTYSDLRSKTVLVTGGSRSIGHVLAEDGPRQPIASRTEKGIPAWRQWAASPLLLGASALQREQF
jgi:hypothetical protein